MRARCLETVSAVTFAGMTLAYPSVAGASAWLHFHAALIEDAAGRECRPGVRAVALAALPRM